MINKYYYYLWIVLFLVQEMVQDLDAFRELGWLKMQRCVFRECYRDSENGVVGIGVTCCSRWWWRRRWISCVHARIEKQAIVPWDWRERERERALRLSEKLKPWFNGVCYVQRERERNESEVSEIKWKPLRKSDRKTETDDREKGELLSIFIIFLFIFFGNDWFRF